jgi:hypothetical protein
MEGSEKTGVQFQSQDYAAGVPLEVVLDLGESQVALRIQAVEFPASDSCPDSIGAVERIIPPQ